MKFFGAGALAALALFAVVYYDQRIDIMGYDVKHPAPASPAALGKIACVSHGSGAFTVRQHDGGVLTTTSSAGALPICTVIP